MVTKHSTSTSKLLNTGSPQGCVLSPLLFVLYTNELNQRNYLQTKVIKFADDTAILGLISNNEESEYMQCIREVGDWCKGNGLLLNVEKTKEIAFDWRKAKTCLEDVNMEGKIIERVEQAKYLGLTLDNNLNFTTHAMALAKKLNRRFFLIQKISRLCKSRKILKLCFDSYILSSLLYGSSVFYNSLSASTRCGLCRCVKKAEKQSIRSREEVEKILNNKMLNQVKKIMSNTDHPLNCYYKTLQSGKRLSNIYCRTKRYQDSFVPSSILAFNSF